MDIPFVVVGKLAAELPYSGLAPFEPVTARQLASVHKHRLTAACLAVHTTVDNRPDY